MSPQPPRWMTEWCRRELRATPVEVLFLVETTATVVGVRLDDASCAVVKSRPDESGRAAACVAVQRAVAESGLPCARPLTEVTLAAGRAIHAEEWRPGGQMLRGEDARIVERFAALFAELMAVTAELDVPPPLPNPLWVRWDAWDPARWPPSHLDERAAGVELPAYIQATARRARARVASAGLADVIGHADWETQNLRWQGDEPHAIHDWDSLACMPEAALVGAASGAFASAEIPTLASLDSSAAFLDVYERVRGRRFTQQEREVAWAASLLPVVHNARAETLYASPPVASTALREQASARLALAGA